MGQAIHVHHHKGERGSRPGPHPRPRPRPRTRTRPRPRPRTIPRPRPPEPARNPGRKLRTVACTLISISAFRNSKFVEPTREDRGPAGTSRGCLGRRRSPRLRGGRDCGRAHSPSLYARLTTPPRLSQTTDHLPRMLLSPRPHTMFTSKPKLLRVPQQRVPHPPPSPQCSLACVCCHTMPDHRHLSSTN